MFTFQRAAPGDLPELLALRGPHLDDGHARWLEQTLTRGEAMELLHHDGQLVGCGLLGIFSTIPTLPTCTSPGCIVGAGRGRRWCGG